MIATDREIAPDSTLDEIFDPVGGAAFLVHHWGQTHIHIGGTPTRFDRLFMASEIDTVLREAAWTLGPRSFHRPPVGRGFYVRARFDLYEEGVVSRPQMFIWPQQIESFLGLGATIDLGIVSQVPALMQFAANLAAQLRYPASIDGSCWMSPPGRGVDLVHYDPVGVLVLHLKGLKRWRLQPGISVRWPTVASSPEPPGSTRENVLAEQAGRHPEQDFVQLVMKPGDLLYVPPGCYHATENIGHEETASLNFYFEQRTFADIMSEILAPVVERKPDWRTVPVSCGQRGSATTLPAETIAFVRARIREAVDYLDSVGRDVVALSRVVSGLVASENSWKDFARASSPRHELAPDSRLRVVPLAPLVLSETGEGLLLFHGTTELAFDEPELRRFAQNLVVHRNGFAASLACRWYGDVVPWERAREDLAVLLDKRVIEHVGGAR